MIKRLENRGSIKNLKSTLTFEKQQVLKSYGPYKIKMPSYHDIIVAKGSERDKATFTDTNLCSGYDADSIAKMLVSVGVIKGNPETIEMQANEVLRWNKTCKDAFMQQFMKLKERYAPIDVEEEKKMADVAKKLDGDCGCHSLYSCPHIDIIEQDQEPVYVRSLLNMIENILFSALVEFKNKKTAKEVFEYNKEIVGKCGKLDNILKLLKFIPVKSRIIIGTKLNVAHESIEKAVQERLCELNTVKTPFVVEETTKHEQIQTTIFPQQKLEQASDQKDCNERKHSLEEDIDALVKELKRINNIDYLDYKQKYYDLYELIMCLNLHKTYGRDWAGGGSCNCILCELCKVSDKKENVLSTPLTTKPLAEFSTLSGAYQAELKISKDPDALNPLYPINIGHIKAKLKAIKQDWRDELCEDCLDQYLHDEHDGDICPECSVKIKRQEDDEKFLKSIYGPNFSLHLKDLDYFKQVKNEKMVLEDLPTVNGGQTSAQQISENIVLDFDADLDSQFFIDGQKYLIKQLRFTAVIPSSFSYIIFEDGGKFRVDNCGLVSINSGAIGNIKCREPELGSKKIFIKVFYDVEQKKSIEKCPAKEIKDEGLIREDLEKLEKKLNDADNGVVEISKKRLKELEEKVRLFEERAREVEYDDVRIGHRYND
jgi:hypothetical protein